jgi:predicted PurR-regulated permease PerM
MSILISIITLFAATDIVYASEFENRLMRKLDSMGSEISSLKSELSALKSWKEQQEINTTRFYQINWSTTESRLLKLEETVTEFKEATRKELSQISTMVSGQMTTFTVLGGLFALITPFLLFFMNKRQMNADPLRKELGLIVQELHRERDKAV